MNTNDYVIRTSTCVPMEAFKLSKLINYPQTFAPDGITTTVPGVEVIGSSETESYWTATCTKASQAGCFPSIQRLNVFGFEQGGFYKGYEIDEWEEDEHGLDPGAYQADHWNKHDVLAKKTYRFPVKQVGGNDRRATMLRTKRHVEELGDQRAIEQRVEGPA